MSEQQLGSLIGWVRRALGRHVAGQRAADADQVVYMAHQLPDDTSPAEVFLCAEAAKRRYPAGAPVERPLLDIDHWLPARLPAAARRDT